MITPCLFGIKNSNRDFSNKDSWGKNQFNSSFPAALANYLFKKKLKADYLCLNSKLEIVHSSIGIEELYGITPDSGDLFFAFEAEYSPYQQFLLGSIPRVDLVTQSKDKGTCLRPIEIKLTALPDNSSCDLDESKYGSELVVRPDTIVYLACEFAYDYRNSRKNLKELFGGQFSNISDWSEPAEIKAYLDVIKQKMTDIVRFNLANHRSFMMQPIWKTIGKSPKLAENCLDVFVWSNLAFTKFIIEVSGGSSDNGITRQSRTLIWLFKMLYDYAFDGRINHLKIIDELSYNTKNDKAFASNGLVTHKFMKSPALIKPRITKGEIKNIILGGGQLLLSPERRFDAIIANSEDLF